MMMKGQTPAVADIPINAPRNPTPPLYPGDPAPWFHLDSDLVARFPLSSLGGNRFVMTFVKSLNAPYGRDLVALLLADPERFARLGIGLLIVTADVSDAGAHPPQGAKNVRILFDREGTVSALYGAVLGNGEYAPKTFIVNERLRIAAAFPASEPAAHAARVLELLEKLKPLAPARRSRPQAPVLIIPDIFEPKLCDDLIAGFDLAGGQDSGFMVERDGKTVEERDNALKRRSDWHVQDDAMKAACRARMVRRIIPEVQRGFQFNVSMIERFLVACYDGENRGHFAAHRDNTTRGTAHRRFAVSLNLNDDYEGGYLIFPEFGRTHFKPPKGGACVFSCSLLHEATPVTNGRRFVFVPFLYDEAAQAVRQENAGFIESRE
jgi:predicted 2-oxoglutarate/Fe(II)-dependent dioxygenase YbiX/peroxiredoxin